MHLNCERHYIELCKKQEEAFYANDVLKFVRGEPSGIKPGTVDEGRAKIAKDLLAKNPSLALPENLQELIAAVEAIEREHAVANGRVITPKAEERIPSRREAAGKQRATRSTVMEKPNKDEMSREVCNFAHALLKRGACPLLVVEALIAGILAFAGRIGEKAMRDYINQVDEFDYSYGRSLSKAREENAEKYDDPIPF